MTAVALQLTVPLVCSPNHCLSTIASSRRSYAQNGALAFGVLPKRLPPRLATSSTPVLNLSASSLIVKAILIALLTRDAKSSAWVLRLLLLLRQTISIFVDDRSSAPLHVGVRQLEFSEVLKISGFDDDLNATAFLKSRAEEDALKTVASAIPPPTLLHLYRAIVRHAISVLVSLHEVNGLEETFAIDLNTEFDLPPCDDDDFALFAADVVTQSVNCSVGFQSDEGPAIIDRGAVGGG